MEKTTTFNKDGSPRKPYTRKAGVARWARAEERAAELANKGPEPKGRKADWTLRTAILGALTGRFMFGKWSGGVSTAPEVVAKLDLGIAGDSTPPTVTANNHVRFLQEIGCLIDTGTTKHNGGRGRSSKVYEPTPIGRWIVRKGIDLKAFSIGLVAVPEDVKDAQSTFLAGLVTTTEAAEEVAETVEEVAPTEE